MFRETRASVGAPRRRSGEVLRARRRRRTPTRNGSLRSRSSVSSRSTKRFVWTQCTTVAARGSGRAEISRPRPEPPARTRAAGEGARRRARRTASRRVPPCDGPRAPPTRGPRRRRDPRQTAGSSGGRRGRPTRSSSGNAGCTAWSALTTQLTVFNGTVSYRSRGMRLDPFVARRRPRPRSGRGKHGFRHAFRRLRRCLLEPRDRERDDEDREAGEPRDRLPELEQGPRPGARCRARPG